MVGSTLPACADTALQLRSALRAVDHHTKWCYKRGVHHHNWWCRGDQWRGFAPGISLCAGRRPRGRRFSLLAVGTAFMRLPDELSPERRG